MYHAVRIWPDQIIIENNYTITGNRDSIGGRIGDGKTVFERCEENENGTTRDVTIRMRYTSSQIRSDMFTTDYAFTTELDNDSPDQAFVVWENPNRRMDGEYVWYVELGPNRPTPKAVGNLFVRIDGL